MFIPLLLILFAFAAAAAAAYGTDPAWISHSYGMEIIYLTRRLQGPLFTFCVILCFSLLVLVVSGKRRAWWLIGLAPILVLFAHRFATSPMRDFRVADNPAFVAISDIHHVRDEDFVVGVVYDGTAYAYPYAALYGTPVVVQTIVQERVLVLWNPYANYARVFVSDRGLSARELEVVSMPANALLVYNARYGEFINGVTGLTQHGKSPTGLRRELETYLLTFGRWRQIHPNTKVLPAPELGVAPPVPLKPRYPIPTQSVAGPVVNDPRAVTPALDATVVLLATTRPTAMVPTDLPNTPVNLTVAGESIVTFRDPITSLPRAYSRVLSTGEEVAFAPIPLHLSKLPTTRPNIHMLDTLVNFAWTPTGRVIELSPAKPEWRGLSLPPILATEGPYYSVLRYWYPELNFHHVTAADFAQITPPPEPPPPPRRSRAPRRTPPPTTPRASPR